MEKGRPHRKLTLVKALIEAGRVMATASAFQGARELGIDKLDGICAVVLSLTNQDFHKSMTTYADHRVWQDVYHARMPGFSGVYIKLTVMDDVLIVSFKEL